MESFTVVLLLQLFCHIQPGERSNSWTATGVWQESTRLIHLFYVL